MSIDYWNICQAMPPATAMAALDELAPLQSCHAICGPDGEPLVEPFRQLDISLREWCDRAVARCDRGHVDVANAGAADQRAARRRMTSERWVDRDRVASARI